MSTSKRFLAKNGLDANNQTIINVATPVNGTDAANKNYADLKLPMTGGTMTGPITFTAQTPPTYAAGSLWYDTNEMSLTYYNDVTGNSLHIGKELQQRVRNQTGATITKGKIVYISGATGQTPLIALAQANAYNTSQVLGIVNDDIANNAYGYVTTVGTVTGIDTSVFTDGALVYLSATTAGAMTSTEPSSPSYAVHLGVVTYANGSNGRMYFSPIVKSVDNGYFIGQLATNHGGTGLASFTANGIVYASSTSALATSSNLYFNGSELGVTGSLKISSAGDTYTYLNNNNFYNFINFQKAGVTYGTLLGYYPNSLYHRFANHVFSSADGATEFARINANGVGVNVSNISAWGTNHKAIQLSSNSSSHIATFVNSLTIGVGYYNDNTNFLYTTASAASLHFSIKQGVDQASSDFTWRTSAGGVAGSAITYSDLMKLNTTGLGIGTSTPGAKLEIQDTASLNSSGLYNSFIIRGIYGTSGRNLGIGFAINSSNAVSAGIYSTEDSGAGNNLIFATSASYATPTNTERMRISSVGNVGIGLTPAYKLDVLGSIRAIAAATQDSVIVSGRAGGTGSFGVTITPATLTASRTLTLPDISGTVVTSGDTGTVTNTMLAGSISLSKLSITGTPTTSTFLRGDGTWSTPSSSGGLTLLSTNANGLVYLNSSSDATTSSNLTFDGTSLLTLNNSTSNLILFGGTSTSSPTFTTRSAGAKLVLKSQIGASATDYALGIGANTMWLGVPTSTQSVVWYAGTTQTAILSGSGDFTATGNVSAYSDISLKTDIVTISNALDKISLIQGVTYTRKDTGARHTGVIAQDVEKVLPEAVSTDENGIKSVAYGNMVGILIEAIKELKMQVDSLSRELVELRTGAL